MSFFPYRKELKTFLQLGAPTCLALSGQVATCVAVTVAASGCDTVALAAHQVCWFVLARLMIVVVACVWLFFNVMVVADVCRVVAFWRT